MNTNDNLVLVGAEYARNAAERSGRDLKDRFRAAMAEMQDFYLTTNEDVRFRAALVGVLQLLHEEGDTEAATRINAELVALKHLSALLSGVQVDFEGVFPERPLGLLGMWREVAR